MKPGTDTVEMANVGATEESLIHILVGDVEAAEERMRVSDTQSARRDAIRTAVAAIEGVHWIIKSDLRDFDGQGIFLTSHELACLNEETYSVSESGVLRSQTRFIPLATSIKLLVRLLKRVEPTFELDFDHVGWEFVQSSVRVRNRVTHPKSASDLKIDKAEVSEAFRAFAWILAFAVEALSLTNEARKNILKKLRSVSRRVGVAPIS